jgi:4-carboxymuconolactone decarboxylase
VTDKLDELYDKGLDNRRRVLGSEYVDRAIAGADRFNADFQRLLTTWCWGEIWSQPHLTDRQRSLNNICILAASGKWHEFKLHFKGALTNGCTLDELRETLMQVAVYCGAPAGVEAFRNAREVLVAEKIDVR